jgi:hypothetical protein
MPSVSVDYYGMDAMGLWPDNLNGIGSVTNATPFTYSASASLGKTGSLFNTAITPGFKGALSPYSHATVVQMFCHLISISFSRHPYCHLTT